MSFTVSRPPQLTSWRASWVHLVNALCSEYGTPARWKCTAPSTPLLRGTVLLPQLQDVPYVHW